MIVVWVVMWAWCGSDCLGRIVATKREGELSPPS